MNTVYLSHGGGPLPLLGHAEHRDMVTFLQNLASSLPSPKNIVVISAHWERHDIGISGAALPGVEHDYYGFPAPAYDIDYPAPGQPELADSLVEHLRRNSIEASLDKTKRFDHGVFVPLLLMYPDASVPVVQVSLNHSLAPDLHVELGRLIAEVAPEDTLLIGSGFSFHNMSAFRQANNDTTRQYNLAFEAWLADTLMGHCKEEAHRQQRLTEWHTAPSARFCHPREEHLLPLHVCYGANKTTPTALTQVEIMGIQSSMVVWET